MQLQRQWKIETLILFTASLMLSVSVGMIFAVILPGLLPGIPQTKARFYSSVVSNFFFQGATLVIVHFFLRRNETTWRSFLGLDQPRLGQVVLRAIAAAALVLPMALMVRHVSEKLMELLQAGSELQPALQIIQMSVSSGKLVYAGVIAIFLAPVAEEILFRGILYQALKSRGWRGAGLVGTSLLFGLIHGHLPSFVALSFLGFIFALLYDRTETLLAPIVAHAMFNAVNFFMFLYNQRSGG